MQHLQLQLQRVRLALRAILSCLPHTFDFRLIVFSFQHPCPLGRRRRS